MKLRCQFFGLQLFNQLALMAGILIFAVAMLLTPVLVPAHFGLLALGRKGFYQYNSETQTRVFDITHRAFKLRTSA